jgi:hypothetical protein
MGKRKLPLKMPEIDPSLSSSEKQAAYSKWRTKWFELTNKRKLLKDGEAKKGRPR